MEPFPARHDSDEVKDTIREDVSGHHGHGASSDAHPESSTPSWVNPRNDDPVTEEREPAPVATESTRLLATKSPSKKPDQHWALTYFWFVQALTVVFAITIAGGEIAYLAMHPFAAKDSAVRIYNTLFCALAVVIELDWSNVLTEDKFFQQWPASGLFYGFIGLLAQQDQAATPDISSLFGIVLVLAGYCMMAMGMLYFIMGVLCLRKVKLRLEAHYMSEMARLAHEEALKVERSLA